MKRIEALVNPVMLKWAREKGGYDLVSAAKKINIPVESLKAWEDGSKKPTMRQAMTMAEKYKRPLSLFYLDEPPEGFKVAMTDFRTLPGTLPGTYSPALTLEQRNAMMQRNIVIELSADDESGEFPFIDTATLEQDPDLLADKIRNILKADWQTQKNLRKPEDALKWWRELIECQNVLVFHTFHMGTTVEPDEGKRFFHK